MSDNRVSNPGVGGDTWVVAEFDFSGDTAGAPGMFCGILSGSEGSWTYSLQPGGAGNVDAGTPRVTLAADDPAVVDLAAMEVLLTTIDADTGGIATSAAVMDDWDESDRAKVNVIVGQAGIAGGTGLDGATVPRVTLATNVPLPAGTNGIGKLTANSGVDIGDVDILSIAAGDNNIGNVDIASIAAGDNNIGNVDVVTLPNVTLAAGTNTNEVVGDAAHGAEAAGNPLLQGLEGRSTDGTAVDSGDVVRALASLLGKQVVIPHSLPGAGWDYAGVSGGITDTNDDVAKAAAGSGSRNYVTAVQVVNGHATVSTEVVIKTGSTVIWRGWAQAAGGGVAITFAKPLRGGDNEAINVTNITTGSQTYFNLQGYSAAE